jgi:general secretion pathway protein G
MEVEETMTEREKRRRRQRGFTLIELLVVMVILGLLASLVAPNIFGAGEKARVQATRTQISSLSTALDAFALDTGRYPNSSEGLDALVDAPSGLSRWDGPYIKKIPTDAWGRPFEYSAPTSGSNYTVKSLGADGAAGGDARDADITNND